MKIFVSYTVRDKEITPDVLYQFSQNIRCLGNVFVDLLDNDSEDKQKRVISELKSSDLIVLIKSASIFSSKWVQFELEMGNNLQIPIVEIKAIDIPCLNQKEICALINNCKSC